ncbi:MAG: hypothetical protein WA081_20390 [Desulfosalsimonadaceae bacterium]
MTQDIDLCLLCGFGNEKPYIKELSKQYKSRIDDAFTFAVTNRVLLLYAKNGVAVDISLSGLPFEEEIIQRATVFQFEPECSLLTCSAEDLVILKAFAERSKDWNDIEGIVMKHGRNLDTNYIVERLTPLCDLKESPEIIPKLKSIFKNIGIN